VVVEPVAWVAGREELLMTLGALGCIHFHLTARRLEEALQKRRAATACHALAALCCAFGCLSNAVAAVIPLLITAWDLITLERPKFRRIVWGTWALWVIGAATIVIKKLGPAGPAAPMTVAFSAGWLMSIPAVYWLYLKSLAWPTSLALSYVWSTPTTILDVRVVLGLILIAVTCLVLWLLRRQKLALFGLVWFGLALAPAAQIMPHHVAWADRFLYLPLVGLAVVLAMGLAPLANVFNRRPPIPRFVPVALSAPLLSTALVLLVTVTTLQLRTWRNSIAVWQNCLEVCPYNHLAIRGLADELAHAGRYQEAFSHYKRSLWFNTEDPKTMSNFARAIIACDEKDRDYDLALRLAECACELTQSSDPEFVRTLAMVYNSSALAHGQQRRFEQAVHHYRKAMETDPEYVNPVFNLALLLATCADPALRRPDEAVRLAERACRMVDQPDANHLMILAVACAQAGQRQRAVSSTQKAIQLAQAAGNAPLAKLLKSRLTLYQSLNPPPSAGP